MVRWRQRFERYIYTPRNTKDFGQPPEARRKAWDSFSPTPSRRNQPCQHLDLGLLVSGTVTGEISIVVKPPSLG